MTGHCESAELARIGKGGLYVSLSAGNAALACGYEGSAFQAAVLNYLTIRAKITFLTPDSH
ncbi:MAG: hypothetical protein LBG92_02810 [Prevotellaceae bacterium]|nr:hypothetical protein [Prevotellaceae bacterium]